MGFSIGGKRGIVSDPNVVPLIDILLVLLVIFMVIPHHKGLDAQIPQPSTTTDPAPPPDVVVVQVLEDGTLRLNQQPVTWDALGTRLGDVFKSRASRTAFIRGDGPVEFGVVARVIDVMRSSGVVTVGLLTPDLEKSF